MRLISFLGKGKYGETEYYQNDGRVQQSCQTHLIAHALSEIFETDEVYILATQEAKESNQAELENKIKTKIQWVDIPVGENEDELHQQFNALYRSMQGCTELILDITHGFRSQPFFAAAVFNVLHANQHLPSMDKIQIVYGKYNQGGRSPIWNLNPFIEYSEFAQAVAILHRTGHGQLLVEKLKQWDEQERRAEAQKAQPNFNSAKQKLIKKIESFTHDLAGVRIKDLITKSSKELEQALDRYEQEQKQFDTLKASLAELKKMVADLQADSLDDEQGLHAMKNLAQYYKELQRYPEAITVVREGWINCFLSQNRAQSELCWRINSQDNLSEIRNDMLHGGFNRSKESPHLSGKSLAENVEKQVKKFVDEADFQKCELQYWLVDLPDQSVEWLKEQGIQGKKVHWQELIDQLKKKDIVIGQLSMEKAIQIIDKKADYYHLHQQTLYELYKKN